MAGQFFAAARSSRPPGGAGLMNVMFNRIDPNLPDPIESRRRSAGRLVRIAYATVCLGTRALHCVFW